jgi:tetratricopeptide (TPR) repeat protein
MNPKALVTALIEGEEEDLSSFIEQHRGELTAEVFEGLEERVNHLRLQAPVEALRIADLIVQVSTMIEDEVQRANGLRLRGNVLIHQGEYEACIASYQEAREIRSRREEELEIARLQVGWTAALKNLHRLEEALEIGLNTQKLLLRQEKWDWLANLEMNIGAIYRLMDKPKEALPIYEASVTHFKMAGNPVGAAQTQVNASRSLIELDRFREAGDLLQAARLIFEAHEKWQPRARADLNLGTLAYRSGRYQEAWEAYNRARQGFHELGNEMEVAICDLYLSRVHLALNLYPEAGVLAEGARGVFEKRGMGRYVALSDLTLAAVKRGIGEYQEALDLFEGARTFFVESKVPVWAALIDIERGALLLDCNRLEEAVEVVRTAIAVLEDHHQVVRLAQARLLLGECLLAQESPEEAAQLYQSVVELPAEQELPTLVYRAYYGLGRVAEMLEKPQEALEHYRLAVAELGVVQRGLRVDEFKAGFLDDKLEVYQAAVRLSLEQERVEEAFRYVERAKSSALLDLLARNLELRGETGEPVDPETWEKLNTLRERWAWHYNKMVEPPLDEGDSTRNASKNGNGWEILRDLEGQINQALREVQGRRYRLLSGEVDLPVETLTASLDSDTLLVEYFCLGDHIVAFTLSRAGLQVCQDIQVPLLEVKRSIGILNLSMRGLAGLGDGYVKKFLNPLTKRHLNWLHEVLVAPLGDAIDDYQRLIIAPDDILHQLPFHALMAGERFLIEDHLVGYVPGAEILELCRRLQAEHAEQRYGGAALVMGYSQDGRLPHILEEVEAVSRVLSDAASFSEAGATRERLAEFAPVSRLIHLASHGTFREDNPLFSSLSLADGPLTVLDVYQFNLRASLVTLSACDTGMSQLKGGDLFGLARGWLYAGVPSLVASLWPVEDTSTAAFMEGFYRRLEAGESAAAALRAAQLEMLRGKDGMKHPYYWAPFVLIGADLVMEIRK